VEQYERIRRDYRDEGCSIRELAVRHRVHRRVVRAALADAVPPARKVPERARPVSGQWEDTVRGWLEADLSEPRKQRHTARRVWQRLLDEHDAVVAESTIRHLVHDLKVEIGLDRRLVTVPQTHDAGRDAEVDFGEFIAVIDGERLQLHMFVMRLSHSGRAVHIASGTVGSEAFLDGHVRAFEAFGGVPTGQIRYDNLKPAVLRVLLGRERLENPKFIALRSHYGFDSFFCEPGVAGAHEKGLVSYCASWGGWGRNSAMEPVSSVAEQVRVAGVGGLVEPFVLVVGFVGDEQAGAAPGLDGVGMDAELLGDFGDSAHALCTESFRVAGELVFLSDVNDNCCVEGLSAA
jgi:transposase